MSGSSDMVENVDNEIRGMGSDFPAPIVELCKPTVNNVRFFIVQYTLHKFY